MVDNQRVFMYIFTLAALANYRKSLHLNYVRPSTKEKGTIVPIAFLQVYLITGPA